MFRPRKDRIINAIRPLFPAVGPQLQRPSRAWHVAPDRLAIAGWVAGWMLRKLKKYWYRLLQAVLLLRKRQIITSSNDLDYPLMRYYYF